MSYLILKVVNGSLCCVLLFLTDDARGAAQPLFTKRKHINLPYAPVGIYAKKNKKHVKLLIGRVGLFTPSNKHDSSHHGHIKVKLCGCTLIINLHKDHVPCLFHLFVNKARGAVSSRGDTGSALKLLCLVWWWSPHARTHTDMLLKRICRLLALRWVINNVMINNITSDLMCVCECDHLLLCGSCCVARVRITVTIVETLCLCCDS